MSEPTEMASSLSGIRDIVFSIGELVGVLGVGVGLGVVSI
jgi:hypothetical protein